MTRAAPLMLVCPLLVLACGAPRSTSSVPTTVRRAASHHPDSAYQVHPTVSCWEAPSESLAKALPRLLIRPDKNDSSFVVLRPCQ